MTYANDFNKGQKSAQPKSAKPKTVRTVIIIGVAAAGFTIAGAMAMPAISNLLLQPWQWGATQIFSGVVNTVAWQPQLSQMVVFSTRAIALTAYAAIQTVQIAETIFELCGVRVSPGSRAVFKKLRTVAYAVEAPLNFFFVWETATGAWLIRLLQSLVIAAAQTLVFEKVVEFGGSFIKACIATINDHRRGNVSNKTIDMD